MQPLMTRTQEQLEFPYGAANWRVDVLVLGFPEAALQAAGRVAQVLGESADSLRMEPLSHPKHGVTEGVWLPPQFFERPETFSASVQPGGYELELEWASLRPEVGSWLKPIVEHRDEVAVSLLMRWGFRRGEVKGSSTVVEELWMWPPSWSPEHGESQQVVISQWPVAALTDLMAATLSPNGELFDEDGWKQLWHLDSIKGAFPLDDLPPATIPAFESWYRSQCLQAAWPTPTQASKGVRL